jgi:hypothetical protein
MSEYGANPKTQQIKEHTAHLMKLTRQGRLDSLLRRAAAERRAIGTGEYVPQTAGRTLRFLVQTTPKAERPLCGARTRSGGQCRAKVVDGTGRCRMHGGLSTGPKTPEGRAAIAESNRRRARQRQSVPGS